jgi:hypothetical protein
MWVFPLHLWERGAAKQRGEGATSGEPALCQGLNLISYEANKQDGPPKFLDLPAFCFCPMFSPMNPSDEQRFVQVIGQGAAFAGQQCRSGTDADKCADSQHHQRPRQDEM